MKHITLSWKKAIRIDMGEQVDFDYNGLPMYAVKNPYGDYTTPNGTKFEINFYAPTEYTMEVKFRK